MHTHNFKIFQTINTFGRDIYNGKITLKEGDKDQSSLLVEIMDFKKKTKPKLLRKNNRKKMFSTTYMHFLRVGKEFLVLLKT